MEELNDGTETKNIGLESLKSFFSVTSGLTLSQVKEITGMSSPSIQNWINRGWLPSPVAKKYSINHIARILIIKTIKSILSFDRITFLLSYINGDLDDTSDDIIEEAKLYEYICHLKSAVKEISIMDNDELDTTIEKCLSDYNETTPGAYKRLFKALKIIILAFYSSSIKNLCLEMIENIKEE